MSSRALRVLVAIVLWELAVAAAILELGTAAVVLGLAGVLAVPPMEAAR